MNLNNTGLIKYCNALCENLRVQRAQNGAGEGGSGFKSPNMGDLIHRYIFVTSVIDGNEDFE